MASPIIIGRTPDQSESLQSAFTKINALLSGALTSGNASATAAPSKIPQFFNVGGTGIPGLAVVGSGMIIQHQGASGTDVHSFRIDRTADYKGGQFGFVNAALRVNMRVEDGNYSFENAALFHLDHYGNVGATGDTTPQNTGVAIQSNKYGTAPIWASVIEAIDRTGVGDPIAGHIGIELDVTGNGGDAHQNRYGIAIFSGRPGNASGNFTGDPQTVGTGIGFFRQSIDSAPNRFDVGIRFGIGNAITDFGIGIDFTGATFLTGGPAIKFRTGQSFAWSTEGNRTSDYTDGLWNYRVNGSAVFQVATNGNISSSGNTVRIASSNTPTNSGDMRGNTGDICWDNSNVYVKTSGGWRRSPLQSF
jgi:hypothetical protein